jgi:N-acetyl sugar amidotransferase
MKTLFGLPEKVEFCRVCVMSSQRPSSCAEYAHTKDSRKETIRFVDGICEACRVAERKKEIDWAKRREDLAALCDRFRSKDGKWDCIVSSSGGKDSDFQAYTLKHDFGMHPLTITWSPSKYTSIGRANLDAMIQSGYDNILVTPSGKTNRVLMRCATENLFHVFQCFILGQKYIAPKMAAKLGIGLVVFGESEAEYGNPAAEFEKATRDHSYYTLADRSKVFLGGVPVSSLVNDYGLTEGDLELYMPASPESQKGIEVHFLGHYLRWTPQACYYLASEKCGFKANDEGRTWGTYSKMYGLDDVVDDWHFWTTHVKFGVGRCSYDASQEIRSGHITREEGVALVKRFDGEFPGRNHQVMMDYLSLPPSEFPQASKMFDRPVIDMDYFMTLSDRFRSPHLWSGRTLRHGVWM